MAPGWFKRKAKGERTPVGPNPAPAPEKLKTVSRTVSIGALLTEELVLVPARFADKNALIEALVCKLATVRSLPDPDELLKKVLEREQGISTTLDTGLSLPHARVPGLAQIAAILAALPQGIPDPKQPDLVIRAVFLFFSPDAPAFLTKHLHLLRGVSALLQPELIASLAAAASPAQALEILRREEK